MFFRGTISTPSTARPRHVTLTSYLHKYETEVTSIASSHLQLSQNNGLSRVSKLNLYSLDIFYRVVKAIFTETDP